MVTYRVYTQLKNKHAQVRTFNLAEANKRYGKDEFQAMQQGNLPNYVVIPIASNGFLLQGE